MIAVLKEIAGKLWDIGKVLVPGMAVLEFMRWLFTRALSTVTDWILGILNGWKTAILQQMETLGTDLTPPPVFMEWVAKINVVIPLNEMWNYFLLYIALASVLVGIKWFRNLIPGFK